MNLDLAESAVKKIKSQAKCLRIIVKSGGCFGFQYEFQFLDNYEDSDLDLKTEKEGAVVVVDKKSYKFLSGCTILYKDDVMSFGFEVMNPNATGKCGCGTSFGI